MADETTNTNPQGESTPPATPPAAQSETKLPAGEKTFTQAEVEKLIQERIARTKAPESTTQEVSKPQDTALQQQLAAMQQTLVQTEVKAQLAINGIQPEKVERAVRLVDHAKCTGENGSPDVTKITAEIEALVKDFPELKAATAEGSAGFKIGADGTSQDKPGEATADAVSKIFGNKK